MSSIDEVSRIAIWREHVKKEGALVMRTEFSLSHPNRLQGIPEKPNKVDPRVQVNEEATLAATTKLNDLSQTKDTHLLPFQKYKTPQTTSQQYGWVQEQLMKPRNRFTYGKGQCDVTTYADHYYAMSGRSPYASGAASALGPGS
ncbi:unnamed protein product [Pedinophyceae sp. YPF-701]|nr:unnamed protein product [Pedinophyceae sp. YPF-701]